MSTDISRPCGVFNRSYNEEFIIIRTKTQWFFLLASLLFIFTLPLYANGYLLNIMNYIGILIISLLGLHILMGCAGQISMGQSAFMAVGAYVTGILMKNANWSFFAAVPIGAIICGILGIIVGLPSLRVKGFYLVMATLAAQVIIPWVLSHAWPDVLGGALGINVPPIQIGDYKFTEQGDIFYVVWIIVLLATFFAVNLMRTRTGRAFIAIRDNDLAAEITGISLMRYKLLAFLICSIYAGIAGGLWSIWTRFLTADQFTLHLSVLFLGMLIVGGVGSCAGVFMGVFFLVGIDEITKNFAQPIGEFFGLPSGTLAPALAPIVYGLIILLFLIFEPRGLAHRWQLLKMSYRLNPFSY